MKGSRRAWFGVICGLLAAGSATAMPAPAEAGWLGFRNETNSNVVVQISHVAAPNRIQHGQPQLLLQGNLARERILQPGTKLITIYDATQPKRILFQGQLPYAGQDLFFAIQPDAPAAGQPQPPGAPPKLKLVPTKPPALPGQVAPGP